jgi:hypothetical protein
VKEGGSSAPLQLQLKLWLGVRLKRNGEQAVQLKIAAKNIQKAIAFWSTSAVQSIEHCIERFL